MDEIDLPNSNIIKINGLDLVVNTELCERDFLFLFLAAGNSRIT